MDLFALRVAVADHLAQQIAGTNVYAFPPIGGVVAPYIAVDDNPDLMVFHETMRAGAETIRLTLTIRVTAATGEDTRRMLDAYLSYGDNQPQSILNAVRAHGPIHDLAAPHLRQAAGAVYDDTGGAQTLILDLHPRQETS